MHWTITAPVGAVPQTGHLRLNGPPDDKFVADAIAEVTERTYAPTRPVDRQQQRVILTDPSPSGPPGSPHHTP